MQTYILLCPVCCSTVDAESEEGQGVQELYCGNCEQIFFMEISADRQAQHSTV